MNNYCKFLDKFKSNLELDSNLFHIISNNPNLTIHYVKHNLHLKWNWNCLSTNERAITLENILDNPELPWSYYNIIQRSDITIDFFRKIPISRKDLESIVISMKGTLNELVEYGMENWNFGFISNNPNLTNEFIELYINYPWNWTYLFYNKNIDYKLFIDKNKVLFDLDNMLNYLSRFSLEMIIKYYFPKYFLESTFWQKLSQNIYLTKDFIEEYIDYPWNWNYLSTSNTINELFIDKHISKPWDFNNLSSNKNITIRLVKKHLDKPWNFLNLSRNPSITFNDIKNNLDLPWDFNVWILRNPNIKFKDLENLPIEKIRYIHYLSNPNLKFEDLEKIPVLDYRITLHFIMLNELCFDKHLMEIAKKTILRYYRKYKLVYRVKHCARQSYVVDELKYKPMFGIKYFETHSDIEDILLTFKK